MNEVKAKWRLSLLFFLLVLLLKEREHLKLAENEMLCFVNRFSSCLSEDWKGLIWIWYVPFSWVKCLRFLTFNDSLGTIYLQLPNFVAVFRIIIEWFREETIQCSYTLRHLLMIIQIWVSWQQFDLKMHKIDFFACILCVTWYLTINIDQVTCLGFFLKVEKFLILELISATTCSMLIWRNENYAASHKSYWNLWGPA